MKFLLAFALVVSSTLSFAQHTDPVIDAIVHDINTTEISCDWSDLLNTMSDFEAQYNITTLLGGLRTEYTIDGNVINAVSISVGQTKRMYSKIVLSKDQTRVKRVDFKIETIKKYTVNTGTILKPSYEDRYNAKVLYSASCIVR